MQEILKKYKGKLPLPKRDSIYNDNLRALFKHLKLDRMIVDKKTYWNPKFNNSENGKAIPLYEMICSSFARPTLYVLCGAMREPIERTMKRTGHRSLTIVMRNYYAIGEKYDEKDITEIMQIFSK